MRKKTNKNSAGFTLLELMVVISIITLLASILLVDFRDATQKAQASRLVADEHQIQIQFDLVRQENNEVLGLIAGNWCNACEFNGSQPIKAQTTALADNNAAWKNLGFPNGAPLDPWGYPYLLDANEYQPGYPNCGRNDMAYSVGPNGMWDSTDQSFDFIPDLPGVGPLFGDDSYLAFSLFQCLNPSPAG